MTEAAVIWFFIGVFVGVAICVVGLLTFLGMYAQAVKEQEGQSVEEKLRIHPR